MDTFTHIVLGACAGEVIAGKKLGKQALLIGAIANAFPDIDTMASLWMPTHEAILAHRGLTHSFLFMIITTFLFSFLFREWWKKRNLSLKFWFWFFGIEVGLHLFIDVFNAYGTGLFEPFSHYRVSFNTLFVADPFYTIWLVIASVMLIVLKTTDRRRWYWTSFGLGLSLFYLVYSISNKLKVDMDAKTLLKNQHISYQAYLSTPTPLNTWLWYIVAGDSSGFYTGYYSIFDKSKKIDLHYFPKNDSLLKQLPASEEVQHLIRFSKSFYTIEKWNDTIVFNDLRFGQIVGWYDPNEHFAFHYFLGVGNNNKLVVQRGRFENWNKETMHAFVKRIKGN